MAEKEEEHMMFNDLEVKRIVKTFDVLRNAIYEVNGLCRSSDRENMRAAEHCASRIIAARIIAKWYR